MSKSQLKRQIAQGKRITWICQECGDKYCNGPQFDISTWHEDVCDVCLRYRLCTEPRDFGHLKADFHTQWDCPKCHQKNPIAGWKCSNCRHEVA